MADYTTWTEWFLSLRGNEYYCQVDEDYILDRFDLTGIGNDVPLFKKAYELICGQYSPSEDPDERPNIDKAARHIYSLIHARFILTSAGLEKMLSKYELGTFGACPRVLCEETKLLPIGISDIPGVEGVKLFCPQCEDVYCPKSARHASVDGAYFGTTFAHMFLQTYPEMVPVKSNKKYVPKIFGFKIADRIPKQQPSESNENNFNDVNMQE